MDVETGYYYLQSRYYDPALRRFISSDSYGLLSTLAEAGDINLFAYCGNNPVMCVDPTGEFPFFILTAIIGAIVGLGVTAAIDYFPDKEFNLHWGYYVLGAGIGAIVGAGIGMAISYSATGTLTASFTDIRFGYALKAAQNGNYTKLAKFGTHNNRAKQVGIGKYIKGSPNSYEVLSRKYGYTYYEIKQPYWNKMRVALKEKVWNVNRAFLEQQLALGKTFVKLSIDYSGYYLKELIYLGLL
ncbi:MAG: RHS repeat-associated core domain-containing protein [Clostridia bacterium]|nr:RHS repeat-associated core domain-containing protein [Clostridia bacterium]